jgi:hypothetical protein
MNTTALTYVTDGREAIGFVLKRGRSGFEAFSREEKSLGLFKTAPEAANAVFAAASKEGCAGDTRGVASSPLGVALDIIAAEPN